MRPPLETSLAYKYFVAYRLYDGQRFDEIVIPYRPKKSFQKKIRKLLQSDMRLQLCLAFLAVAIWTVTSALAYFVLHGAWSKDTLTLCALPFLAVIGFFALAAFALQVYTSAQPTHIGFSAQGIRTYWIHWFGDKSSPYVPWKDVTNVRMRRTRQLLFDEIWVDILSPSSTILSLRLDGIASSEHRKRLHTALKQFVPADAIDWQLHDTLNPIKVDSYTTMWLEVLSTSPKRAHDSALQHNALIANDRYEIISQIGSGGQAVAYLGKARAGAFASGSPPIDVVLKEFVLPYHAGLNVAKKALDNIQREAELLKKLAHGQIVKVVDLFVEDQRAYMILEHIEGESLRHLVDREGPLSQEGVAALAEQMCDILSHLHNQSPAVIHRDFTPENLILGTDGLVKLIDFNVAQQQESTATRTVVGKHSYIPPEQFRGKATTQSDIYAMGASLFFLLTGRQPEPISTAHPRNVVPSISPSLDGIVARATALDTSLRYTTAEDLRRDLLEWQTDFASSQTKQIPD